MKSIKRVGPISFPLATQDPFLFAIYHKDFYPAGDEKMQAPRKGNGADFDNSSAYRMYHGDRIPGFPQHPHRGFETITCTLEGLTDHTDSLGASGRYGDGDLQWMTAGKGIVHGENFPLINMDKPNTLRLFQIWLNLPKKSKMAKPTQLMFWHENIPYITQEDGSRIRVWAGLRAINDR
jgi:redox-sensitive bicupin YhaK (pirin superfamily)